MQVDVDLGLKFYFYLFIFYLFFLFFWQRLKTILSPTAEWGPAQPEDRKRYLAARGICDLETVETLTEKPIYKPGASPEHMPLSKVWKILGIHLLILK